MFIQITHPTIDKLVSMTREKKLSRGLDIIVLLMIAKHSWGTDGKPSPCVMTAGELSTLLGCSASSVRRALRFLREAGFIEFIYRTRVAGEKIRWTMDDSVAHRRAMKGARTLRNFYRITDQGIGTMVKTKRNNIR